MFRFAKKRCVHWPVTIAEPDKEGTGKLVEHEIEVQYRLMGRQEYHDNEQKDTDALLIDHIECWHGIEDETGAALAYSKENLRALLDVPYVRSALFEGLMSASSGAPAKNSAAGSDG